MGPFFIIGFQRSGTTLLRLMLNAHPALAVPLDTVGLWATYHTMLADYEDLSDHDNARRLVRDLLAEERIKLWEADLTVDGILAHRTLEGYPGIIDAMYRSYAAARGKRQWGDKDPGNMRRIDLLNEWFPTSRFVHIIRDGRDACLSLVKQDFGPDNLLVCASGWAQEVWWVRRIGSVLGPSRYREVKYEALVADPVAQLRGLCAFLGLPYSDAMLSYPKSLNRAIPESKRHLWPLASEPPRSGNAGRWQREMSRSEQICFEKRAASVLRELAYTTVTDRPSGAYGTELRYLVQSWLHATRGCIGRALRGLRQRR